MNKEEKQQMKNDIDEYLKKKVIKNRTINKNEMVEEICCILEKYVEQPKITTEAELLKDGNYQMIKYKIKTN